MAKLRPDERYAPQRYRHRPNVIDGIPYDGTPANAEAIMAWAPGKFALDDYGQLCALTPEGLRYVPEGNTALLDIEGLPYSARRKIMDECFDLAAGNDYSTWLSTTEVVAIEELAATMSDPVSLRELVRRLAASHEARPLLVE